MRNQSQCFIPKMHMQKKIQLPASKNLDLRILHYEIQHDCQKIEMLTKTTATLIETKKIKYEKI